MPVTEGGLLAQVPPMAWQPPGQMWAAVAGEDRKGAGALSSGLLLLRELQRVNRRVGEAVLWQWCGTVSGGSGVAKTKCTGEENGQQQQQQQQPAACNV